MPYLIMRRQIGDFVAAPPYQGTENRYVRERTKARKFTRYVDAFNASRNNETVIED